MSGTGLVYKDSPHKWPARPPILFDVNPSPCDKACPMCDQCAAEKLACEAYERYLLDGETDIIPANPTHERHLALSRRKDNKPNGDPPDD